MHVHGQNLDAFRQIAFGTYSLGNVVLHGEEGLDKTDHHHTALGRFFSASHRNDPEENRKVRAKLLEAIRGDGTLAVKELDVIARRLGINRAGQAVDAQLAGTALRRREIQNIFTFLGEAKLRAEGFAELRRSVEGMLAAAALAPSQRAALENNLLGRGGQLERLYQTSLDLLAGNFLGRQQIKDTARESIALACSAIASMIANAVDYAMAAKTKCDEAASVAYNAALVRLVEIDARFSALDANEVEKSEYQQMRTNLKQHLDSIHKWLEKCLLAFLDRAGAPELNRTGAALDAAAQKFARSWLLPLNSVTEDCFAKLDNQIAAVSKRVADDVEASKVGDCCEVISAMFAKSTEQLAGLQEQVRRLTEFDPQLSTHARLEERRDGDILVDGLKELQEIVTAAFTAKEKLGEAFSAARKGVKSAESELLKSSYQRSLSAVVKDARSQFESAFGRLCGKLQLTVLPKSAEDFEAARKATDEKRKELTVKLEAEWGKAENTVKAYAGNLLKMYPDRYPDVGPFVCKAVEEKFREIGGRFSEERRESFVSRHAAGIMPEKMVKKACNDMSQIFANIEAYAQRSMHMGVECQLKFISRCLDGNPGIADSFDVLVGCKSKTTFLKLTGKNIAKTRFLKREFVHCLQWIQPGLRDRAENLRQGKSSLAMFKQYLDSQLQAIAKHLLDRQQLDRAEQGEEIYERMCRPAREFYEKNLSAIDDLGRSAYEDYCHLMREAVDSQFVRHGEPATQFTIGYAKEFMEGYQLKRLLRPGKKDTPEELAQLRAQLVQKKVSGEGLGLPALGPIKAIDDGVDDQLYAPNEGVPGIEPLPRLDQNLKEGVGK